MSRKLTAAIACLFFAVGPVFADEDWTPKEIRAGSTLDIHVDGEACEAAEWGFLRISGLTLEEIQEAKAAGKFDVTVFPLQGVQIRASFNWLTDDLEIWFRAANQGEYLVALHLVRDDRLEAAKAVVTVEGENGPDPPDPPPPPISGDRLFLMMLETEEKTPGQETVILAIRKYLESWPKVTYRQADPSQASQAPWISRCLSYLQQQQTSLPALVACVIPEGKSINEAVFLDACSFPGRHQEAVAWAESQLKGLEP